MLYSPRRLYSEIQERFGGLNIDEASRCLEVAVMIITRIVMLITRKVMIITGILMLITGIVVLALFDTF